MAARGISVGVRWLAGVALMAGAPAVRAQSSQAPHSTTQSVYCISCHLDHHSALGDQATALGNPNLCHSCHAPGGLASRYALADADLALIGPGLPAGVNATGTSHRWDSGLSGTILFQGGAQTNSTGTVYPLGDYTGRVAKTYVLTIVSNGQLGVAKFTWSGTPPGGGGGTNLTVASAVALNQGISVAFSNGTLNPSFRIGDQWHLYVRPDISAPTNPALLGVISGGLLACSVCHDQHSQTNAPFDPAAPTTPGAAGRHFMRIDNSSDQLCVACHAARDVTNSALGSHPVGVTIPSNALFRGTTNLPLERTTGKVRCLTCHDVHNSGSSDGSLTRIASRNALCVQCHAQADTNLCAHLIPASTNMLWPGGQYGSTYPAETDPGARATCNNCHLPHGWPTSLVSSVDFTNLLVDFEERLCFTCHDGAPAAATNSILNDFTNTTKVSRHPVRDDDLSRKASRPVECTDCHNPHKLRIGRTIYATTASSARNLAPAPLAGASGVAVSFTGLGNFVAPPTNNYTFTNSVTFEYQVCLKCHSAYAWGTNTPPAGLSPNGTVTNPVQTDLAQQFSPMNRSGHPIITGLSNYPNSFAPKSLTAARLLAPWNTTTNLGKQTMLCTDCHNTDSALAQGPHGSAARFMLRGPNSANWPNVTLANRATAWCANCHTYASLHSEGNHSSMRCYECHIVIPHGGAMSRLIADRDGSMPARYAYNNNKTLIEMTSFTKDTSYNGDGECGTACGDHNAAGAENW